MLTSALSVVRHLDTAPASETLLLRILPTSVLSVVTCIWYSTGPLEKAQYHLQTWEFNYEIASLGH